MLLRLDAMSDDGSWCALSVSLYPSIEIINSAAAAAAATFQGLLAAAQIKLQFSNVNAVAQRLQFLSSDFWFIDRDRRIASHRVCQIRDADNVRF